MNPRRNIARRDPEQDTNRVDPTKHVQKTQPSENDKVMLSDTEKAVALRHEESEDLALICKPHDEANERLKAKVLLNFSRKFDVSSLHADLSRPGLDSAQVMGMTADEPHAAEDVMENGQYFAKTWQITVRAKVDTYDGEPSVKVTRVQAVVAQLAVIWRKMVALAASCRRLVCLCW